jgi:predicted SAM-dependent methyltransferase
MSRNLRKVIEIFRIFSAYLLYYPYLVRNHFFFSKKLRCLHIGCGKNYFDGWINADIDPRADLIIFLQKKLPFKENYLQRIYMEHVLEHVSYQTGVFFLKEAHRTLELGGVIRVALPDLDELIEGYCEDWRGFDWVNWPEFSFIKTKAEMINIAFRWWGHKHLYNREELIRAFLEAGFSSFNFERNGNSRYIEFQGLETRIDSKLIVEAIKE